MTIFLYHFVTEKMCRCTAGNASLTAQAKQNLEYCNGSISIVVLNEERLYYFHHIFQHYTYCDKVSANR